MKYIEAPNCVVCGFNNYDCNGKCTIPTKEVYRCGCCGADKLSKDDVIEMSNGIHFCKDCYEEQEGGEDES